MADVVVGVIAVGDQAQGARVGEAGAVRELRPLGAVDDVDRDRGADAGVEGQGILGVAVTVLATEEEAVSDATPPSRSCPGGPRPAFERTSALLVMFAIVIANEPATPRSPSPTPEVASATRSC